MRPRLVACLIVLVLVFLIFYSSDIPIYEKFDVHGGKSHHKLTETVISIVACGEGNSKEALNSVKSALLFSSESDRLKFIIFSDPPMLLWFDERLREFQSHREFSFDLRNSSFPEQDHDMWVNLFRPCAAQRLFFPSLLTDVDALIYIDSDTLFLSSPSEFFQIFESFNDSQIGGMAPESLSDDSWYPLYSQVPFYGRHGLNSGVLLMNLTRMREINYQEKLLKIYWEYNTTLKWQDQDMMNIFFHENPDKFFEIPCEFNFRTDFCEKDSICEAKDGIKLIHGNRFSFFNSELIFGQIYNSISMLPNVSELQKL
jgi:UDP-xylose:glucoside alpha-1,3-xylosyltransferase